MGESKNLKVIGLVVLFVGLVLMFTACDNLLGSDKAGDGDTENGNGDEDVVIDIAEIPGVTAPVGGETPVIKIIETTQYTGTVSWSPFHAPFHYETDYTATITLTAKDGYTLTGVDADFFKVDGADPVSNDADSGEVTAVFPETKYVLGDFYIGDDGPAGGIIFYIDKAEEHNWTYLEVAPYTTEWTGKEWGDDPTEIGGDAALTSIGDGQAATDAIVAHMEEESITDTAAQICDVLEHEYEGTIYNDWFLPSKDELGAIWDNIVNDGYGNNSGVGGFANENYWSSSESDFDDAWDQNFASGFQEDYDKNLSKRVRAVRAF